jgi:hypothetical protein
MLSYALPLETADIYYKGEWHHFDEHTHDYDLIINIDIIGLKIYIAKEMLQIKISIITLYFKVIQLIAAI